MMGDYSNASSRTVDLRAREELLQHLVAEEGIEPFAPIPPRSDPDRRPLSYDQQRLWFLHRLRPDGAAYNVPLTVDLQGELSLRALSTAFDRVLGRHELLRSVLVERRGRPVQRLLRTCPASLPVVDLRGLQPGARSREAGRLAVASARQPFALDREPTLRTRLLRLGHRTHHLLVCMHHVASDLWSRSVVLGEVREGYAAALARRSPDLPELPIQYADYAAWQRAQIESGALDDQLEYWRHALEGAPTLPLVGDRPRPPMGSQRGGRQFFRLPAALTDAARALGRGENANLFMVLCAGFMTLLSRYCGEDDVVVGSPVANRGQPQVQGLVGYFSNTVVLRIDLGGRPTFREAVRRVRRIVLRAHEHGEVPFERVVAALEPERTLSRNPLFQVVVTMGHDTLRDVELEGVRIAPLEIDDGTAKFDLNLFLEDRREGLSGALEFDSDLFDQVTVERLLKHQLALLRSALDDPDRPFGSLGLLSPGERHQLRAEWPGGDVSAPAGAGTELLHDLFGRWARQAPDRVAIAADGEQLSYAEVRLRADRLASRLRAGGVGPETVVGVCLEPSTWLVVSIIAVLQAGGAYLPLDSRFPVRRLRELIDDAGAAQVVVDDSTSERLAGLTVPTLRTSGGGGSAAAAGGLFSAGAAYVIYTSGSTGRPKGVTVAHRSVARLLEAALDRLGFAPSDAWTLFHSPAFDFSVWEIWGALAHGGRLVIVPRRTARSPQAVLDLVQRHRVTMLSQTPSAVGGLLETGVRNPAREPLPLRWVVLGGEALREQTVEAWFEGGWGSATGLANLYGITEVTVHATCRPVERAPTGSGTGSGIGRGLSHARLRVCDARLEMVPVGVAGEICVGGAGLARGYRDLPALTGERFVPDPHVSRPGERIYRSGDLGRWRPSGELEFRGRLDRQLEIRGFRVEPGEIEAVLGTHPAVGRTVVVPSRTGGGHTRLTAYLTASGREPPGVQALRDYLGRRLPEHMMPAELVVLESLPLTANGKVDLDRLPAPERDRSRLGQEYSPPRTLREEILAAVWSQVLEVDRVGVHDDFFALGGDSLLTLRIRSLAEERGLQISVEDLFQHPTVARLAEVVRASDADEGSVPSEVFGLVPERDRCRLPSHVADAYPVTAVQAGMLFYMRSMPEAIVYHNVYTYRLRAPFAPGALQRAMDLAIERHPVLRTGFDLTGFSEPLQLVHSRAELRVPVIDLRSLPEEAQDRAVSGRFEDEKARPFDLSRAPLVRLSLLRFSKERFTIVLTECHPVFDGWSLHAFLAELMDNYLALARGASPPHVGPLECTVRDFVALELAALDSAETRVFWEESLRGAEILPLARRSRGRRISPASRGARLDVPPDVFLGLERLAAQAGVPLRSVLLAAHLEALARLNGRWDVVTGVVTSGRPEARDGDRVLGLFFNLLPLRVVLKPGSWRDLVREVFEAERQMLPHRRYPLVQVEQGRGGEALFATTFNYTHFHVLRDVLLSGAIEVESGFDSWEETHVPLKVAFQQDPLSRRLRLLLRHDSELHGAARMARLRRLFERVLRALATAPDALRRSTQLLGAGQRHQILHEWSGSGRDTGGRGEPSVPEQLAARAAEVPDAVALRHGDELWSFCALARRVDAVAVSLRRGGVGRGSVLGLLATRSPDAVIALLATLRTGAAFLPLDLAAPRRRLARILEAGRPRLVLADNRLVHRLPPGDWSVAPLSGPVLDGARLGESPACRPGPDEPAYMTFTSGTSGRPNGVMVEHRHLASYVRSAIERLELGEGWTYALLSSFAVDLGYTALFPPLVTGGCLCLVPDGAEVDPRRFAATLRAGRVDVVKMVPSHLAGLLASYPSRELLPERCLVLGGESFDRALLDRLRELGAPCRVYNHYGPTEATVGTVAGPVGSRPQEALTDTVPLGRPLDGAEVYVLNPQGELVGPEAAGQLWIGGGSLARGYARGPARTARAFRPHPFRSRPGARLYATGDLARFLGDGRLEFLGRIDQQVKVRGFRVELREVEAVLTRHPAVSEVVVEVHRGRDGDDRLAAYMTGRGSSPSPRRLRAHCRRDLPAYMVPDVFVSLDRIPRTPGGKVDRSALPASATALSGDQQDPPPRNALERAIALIWRDVLQVPRVGIDDHLFDLGGNSLLMLRLQSRMEDALGREVPVVTLFDHPTIREMAAHLGRRPAAARPAVDETTEPAERARARRAAIERRQARGPRHGAAMRRSRDR